LAQGAWERHCYLGNKIRSVIQCVSSCTISMQNFIWFGPIITELCFSLLFNKCQVYYSINGQAPSYLCSKIINMCEQTHRYNTRFQSSGKIKQQLCRTSTGQRSFLVRAINLWNYSIENNIQKENLSIFKKQFKTILLNKFLDSWF
jgi:hypothetical protein